MRARVFACVTRHAMVRALTPAFRVRLPHTHSLTSIADVLNATHPMLTSAKTIVGALVTGGMATVYYLRERKDESASLERKLQEVLGHPTGAVAGGALKDLELGGFGRVKGWIKDRRAGVYIIEGMSGIGKSFSLETALQGKKGVLWISFKREWDAHALSTGGLALNYDAIVNIFEAHKVATGELPIIVIEDIHRAFKISNYGEALGTRIFSLANDGLACVFIMGSEPVQLVLDKHSVTGMAGRVNGSVVLEPIPTKQLQEALTDLCYKKWGVTDAAARERVHKLLSLVGQRMHDIDKVAQAKSYEAALVSVGGLLDRERKHLIDVLKSFPEEETRQSAIELLCALLRSNGAIALKPEWVSATVVGLLMEKNVVRCDSVSTLTSVTERVRFHHATVEAAARVIATRDEEAALYTVFTKMVGAGDAHEEKVRAAMDALNAYLE